MTRAADRVAAAAAKLRDPELAYAQHNREQLAKRAQEVGARDQQFARERAAFEQLKRDVASAWQVVNDAVRRAERAETIAAARINEFRRDNAVRRDVAHRALDVTVTNTRAGLEEAEEQLVRSLCTSPVGTQPSVLARVAGLRLALADEARLRERIDTGDGFSALTSEEHAARVQAARTHEKAVDVALREAHAQREPVATAMKALAAGAAPDPRDPSPIDAADEALRANDRAQAALRAVIAALKGETAKEDQ